MNDEYNNNNHNKSIYTQIDRKYYKNVFTFVFLLILSRSFFSRYLSDYFIGLVHDVSFFETIRLIVSFSPMLKSNSRFCLDIFVSDQTEVTIVYILMNWFRWCTLTQQFKIATTKNWNQCESIKYDTWNVLIIP